jgi:hypothetical protein
LRHNTRTRIGEVGQFRNGPDHLVKKAQNVEQFVAAYPVQDDKSSPLLW